MKNGVSAVIATPRSRSAAPYPLRRMTSPSRATRMAPLKPCADARVRNESIVAPSSPRMSGALSLLFCAKAKTGDVPATAAATTATRPKVIGAHCHPGELAASTGTRAESMRGEQRVARAERIVRGPKMVRLCKYRFRELRLTHCRLVPTVWRGPDDSNHNSPLGIG